MAWLHRMNEVADRTDTEYSPRNRWKNDHACLESGGPDDHGNGGFRDNPEPALAANPWDLARSEQPIHQFSTLMPAQHVLDEKQRPDRGLE